MSRRMVFSVSLAALATMLLMVRGVRAEDAAKDEKPTDTKVDVKVLPDDVPKDETPEQWIQRLEMKYMFAPGRANDEAYEAEKTAFLGKHATDPLRWRLKLIDARRGMRAAGNHDENVKKSKAAIAEVLAAKDAPDTLREQASVLNIQMYMMNGASAGDMTKAISEHIKNFPNSPTNAALAQMLMRSVTQGQDEEKALATLQEFKNSEVASLAKAATEKISEIETLLALKKTPLDLKFTAADGNEFNLESYRGKVVLVDFWATWCGPCVAGMPEVIEQYKKFHDAGFEIVGISFDSDKAALEKFVKEKEMPWVQYFDGKTWQNEYGQKFGIHAIPTMWLVGRDGKVVDFNARADLPSKIEKLVAEKDKADNGVKPTPVPTTERPKAATVN